MNTTSNVLAPKLDELGRWYWPDPECECVRMMRRTGRFRVVLTSWLEEQIAALVELLLRLCSNLKVQIPYVMNA